MKKDQKQKQYLFVCHGKDCLKKDAKEIYRELEREIKASRGKSGFELIKTRCMDRCKDAPCIILDNLWHGRIGLKDIKKVLNKKAVK